MADIYRILPNSTDVSALTRPGLIGPAVAAAIKHRPATATPIQNGDGAMTVSKVAFKVS
jgi:hypothetical protein